MSAPGTAPKDLKVFVRGLVVQAQIGINAHEMGRSQPLTVDIEVTLRPQGVSSIRDTINYERLAARAKALAEGGHVDLVETFAARLARACLEEPLAARVRVRIEKPMALDGAEAAGVEITLED
jgi:dihydroneopterin aldolase